MTQDPDIRRTEKALRAAGLTRRQARALLHAGWGAVVDAAQAEADELRLELDELTLAVQGGTMAAPPRSA